MGRPSNQQIRYRNVGRKRKINKEILSKLEDAFMNACTDEEACVYAGIVPATLYRYQERNPAFRERKEALKMKPSIKARQTVVGSLSDPQHAWRWLEKKDPEFKPTSKVEHGGKIEVEDTSASEGVKKAVEAFNKARREEIIKEIKSS